MKIKSGLWFGQRKCCFFTIKTLFLRPDASRRTDTSEVLSLLSEFNIRPLTSSSVILDKVAMEAGSLGMMDYEGEYLTQDQRESEGPQVKL